jgi:alkylhydroperoxidase family enzyme
MPAKRQEDAMTERVALLPVEETLRIAEQLGLPARFARGGAFRTLAHNPDLVKAVYGQLTTLLLRNRFDTRLRELMIMRIGWVTGAMYEWTQHWRVATEAGIPDADILAVRDWRNAPNLTPADRAILTATDESLAGQTISDATWAEVTQFVTDPAEQVEFVVALGNWTLFSILLRNLRIPLEAGITPWPPDGLVPPAAREG